MLLLLLLLSGRGGRGDEQREGAAVPAPRR
jgi:hypothetical protein